MTAAHDGHFDYVYATRRSSIDYAFNAFRADSLAASMILSISVGRAKRHFAIV